MKVIFIGCVQFSYDALSVLYSVDEIEVVGVVTRKESKFNSDFKSLEELAVENNTPLLFASANAQDDIFSFCAEKDADVIYCFGWSYLLESRILSLPPLGVVGFHPAELPKNRGRHPLIWAIVLGLPKTASTFFFMGEGADDGDILSQETVYISDDDSADDLYKRVTRIALNQIARFSRELSNGEINRIPQDHSLANKWRKRGMADGLIDWRMHGSTIYNLVRALSKPYVGAHCNLDGENITVWKVVIETQKVDENLEPGKVLDVDGSSFLVKCAHGAVWVKDHEFESLPAVGDYL